MTNTLSTKCRYTQIQKLVMDSMRFKNQTVEWFIWKTVIHDDNEFYRWSK